VSDLDGEIQTVEWKETWRDEYLKTIYALANAQGGVIEIGRDDNGVIVGIHDAGKLLEDLPNKIRNAMGVIADVDLQETDARRYISYRQTLSVSHQLSWEVLLSFRQYDAGIVG